MLQIRNLPPEVHRALKARAALAGMSLSEYAAAELRRSVERATREEILARLSGRPVRSLRRPAHEVLREERDQR